MTMFRRSMGSISDAAWLRRQVTRDSELLADIKQAVRLFRSRPAVFGSAALVLAISIGAVSAAGSALFHFVLSPPPYPGSARIVTIWEARPQRGELRGDVAPANFLDWRARTSAFSHMASAEPWSVDMTGTGRPEVVTATKVSAGFFEIVGAPVALGRSFTPEEYTAGRERVVLLSHGFWMRRFGADPSIIGRSLTLDGHPHPVVGVLPHDFDLGLLPSDRGHDAWLPSVIPAEAAQLRNGGWWNVIARVKDDRTVADAAAELEVVSRTLATEYPQQNKDMTAAVVPLQDYLSQGVRRPIAIAAIAGLLVLLVACANVTNLLLSVGLERQQELAVRGAMGASRARLVRQMLTESGLLVFVGGAGGALFGMALIRTLAPSVPAAIPRSALFDFGASTLLATLACAILALLLIGAAPALAATKSTIVDALRGARTTGTGTPRRRLRDGLAVVELAFTLALVAGSALLYRSVSTLAHTDPGFDPDGVVGLQVFAYDGFASPEARTQFFFDTIDRMRAIPGVEAASLSSTVPFLEADLNISTGFQVEGVVPDASTRPMTHISVASPGYFETMRIPLRRGRLFTSADRAGSAPVMLVSDAVARRFWPGTDPIGAFATVRWLGKPLRAQVVGIVGDVHHMDLDTPARDEIYVPLGQASTGSLSFAVRTSIDPTSIIDSLKEAVWAGAPMLTIYDASALQPRIDRWIGPRRLGLWLVGALGAVALVVSAIGLYGVLSFITRTRTHEIGVRMALGADRNAIRTLVLRHAAGVALAGLVLGIAGAVAFGRLLRQFLFGISAQDPLAFAAAAALLLSCVFVAAWIPARRASRTDPVKALKS